MENIVEQIQSGDLQAFKNTYEQYSRKLHAYILRYSCLEYIAEETVQLTFIKLWEKRSQLPAELEIGIQIFRIGKSLLIDILRKEKKHLRTDDISENINTLSLNGERLIINREELRLINKKIDKLPHIRKKVFKLSRIECKSNNAIAEELSISVKTVENHINLALKELKNLSVILLIIILK